MSSLLVRVLAVLVGMVLVTFSAGSEVRAGDDGGRPRVSADGVLVGEAGSGQLTRLPPAAGVTRHYPDGSTERVDVSAGSDVDRASKLIYSNPYGDFLYPPGRNLTIADDLTTNAVTDCGVQLITTRVNGGVENGNGEFSVAIGLWDKCPGVSGAQDLLGTELTFAGLADDMAQDHELAIDFRDVGICDDLSACSVLDQDCADESPCVQNLPELPTTVWLSYRFDTSTAGVILGSPAQVGFSADNYHHPYSPCVNNLGGYPRFPYAAFRAQIFADGTTDEADPNYCPTHFLAYWAASSFGTAFAPGGTTHRMADDIMLSFGIDDPPLTCELSALELGVIGAYGQFDIDVDVRWPQLEDVRPQTQRVFTGRGDGSLEVARFLYEPGLFITPEDQPLYVTWLPDCANVGVSNVRRTQLGSSSDGFAMLDTSAGSPGEWEWYNIPNGDAAVFHIAIFCRGEAPTGACCTSLRGSDVPECIDEANVLTCLGGRWAPGETCAEADFDPPCGWAACCLPDATCEDITKEECDQRGGRWRGESYCSDNDLRCYWEVCGLAGGGECTFPRPVPGCKDFSCCNQVCLADPWCCENDWDEQCVEEASLLCEIEPANNECSNPMPLASQGQVMVNNVRADDDIEDPGFVCHSDGAGTLGYGSIWFEFEAAETSARFHTCASDAEAGDSLLEVYAVDPGDEDCQTLTPLACSDDAPGCGADGLQSDVCVTGIEPGVSYRVQLASKTAAGQGRYRLTVESPCPQAAGPGTVDSDLASVILEPESGGSSPAQSSASSTALADEEPRSAAMANPAEAHHEIPDDAPVAVRVRERSAAFCDAGSWEGGVFSTVQVNVDDQGDNIVGDAANEPSIAISPVDPDVIVIGWRQFDTIESNFRQAGWAYSHDAGATWTFPGVLEPDVFRSDPILAADADGSIHYNSLTLRGTDYVCDVFTSYDGGVSWARKVDARGGDKAWMEIDRTSGSGRNHIYSFWTSSFSCCPGHFTRSTDAGETYSNPIDIPLDPYWGTVAVGLDGAIYAAGRRGNGAAVIRSTNARNPDRATVFDQPVTADIGGPTSNGGRPNPGGLLGQIWVATDHSHSAGRGNVYLLASVVPDRDDPLDLMFARSTDSGLTWSEPVRINDDATHSEAWQWFGTMSVAPNGRIDVVWNDTRDTGEDDLSEVFYSYSIDGGVTWQENVSISPVFDSHVGWPQQNKLGDYYDMISDNAGANLAYAATFNGEQDVYFARIEPDVDCNGNGIPDITEITGGSVADCDGDLVPDVCSPDFDGDGYINGCDSDIDGDGIVNEFDVCNFTPLGAVVTEVGSQRGDFVSDCDIDLRDFRSYRACLSSGGPAEGDPTTDCLAAFDFDGDADIDLADGRLLFNDFTGLIRRAPDTLIK